MRSIKSYIQEKLVINKNFSDNANYKPQTKAELKELVKQHIEKYGNKVDLNNIDTSNITDMSELFENSDFNGDISEWDVSNVEDMNWMFYHSKFDGDLSKWDVSNVKDMHWTFFKSEFTGENGDISKWNVSNVKDMDHMFAQTEFNQDISNWDVSSVKYFVKTFEYCTIKEEYKPKFNE